jgi:hypothetical protein
MSQNDKRGKVQYVDEKERRGKKSNELRFPAQRIQHGFSA